MSEKKGKNIFLIGYVVLMVIMLMMSSCGSSGKLYDLGTGQESARSRCSGNYLSK
tara:strand:- start:137 stop:301 length:165 start_codon:yes stop_codon:yes gene_type:complete